MKTEHILFAGSLRPFIPDNPEFCSKMRAKLTTWRDELIRLVASGDALDFPEYRYKCGKIQTLSEAIEICENMEKEDRT